MFLFHLLLHKVSHLLTGSFDSSTVATGTLLYTVIATNDYFFRLYLKGSNASKLHIFTESELKCNEVGSEIQGFTFPLREDSNKHVSPDSNG